MKQMQKKIKKKTKLFNIFLKNEKKKKKILPERTKLCFVRMYRLFEKKKAFSKEDGKTLESV